MSKRLSATDDQRRVSVTTPVTAWSTTERATSVTRVELAPSNATVQSLLRITPPPAFMSVTDAGPETVPSTSLWGSETSA